MRWDSRQKKKAKRKQALFQERLHARVEPPVFKEPMPKRGGVGKQLIGLDTRKIRNREETEGKNHRSCHLGSRIERRAISKEKGSNLSERSKNCIKVKVEKWDWGRSAATTYGRMEKRKVNPTQRGSDKKVEKER